MAYNINKQKHAGSKLSAYFVFILPRNQNVIIYYGYVVFTKVRYVLLEAI